MSDVIDFCAEAYPEVSPEMLEYIREKGYQLYRALGYARVTGGSGEESFDLLFELFEAITYAYGLLENPKDSKNGT